MARTVGWLHLKAPAWSAIYPRRRPLRAAVDQREFFTCRVSDTPAMVRSPRKLGAVYTLALEERLASLISDLIVPRIVPNLEIIPWRRTHVVAIEVHPSASRPHYLKREGLKSGVYVRVGSTNRRADLELIEELGRFARGEALDEQPMPGLDSEALDFRAASESFAPLAHTLFDPVCFVGRDCRGLCPGRLHLGRLPQLPVGRTTEGANRPSGRRDRYSGLCSFASMSRSWTVVPSIRAGR